VSTMHTTGRMISRRLYAAVRDKHVEILRAFIILCCLAALGMVLFGRDIRVTTLAAAVGFVWLLRSKIWRWFS
jgi:hypothetical protein